MDALQGFNIDICTAASGVPGIAMLEYAGIDEIDADAFEPAVDASYLIRRTATATWHELPFVVGTGSIGEETDADAQGNTFKISISAFLPGDDSHIRAELNRMKPRRFVLRLTGRDTKQFVVGNLEQPLRFESRFESGPQGGDQRGHRCRFSGVSTTKLPEYIPTW